MIKIFAQTYAEKCFHVKSAKNSDFSYHDLPLLYISMQNIGYSSFCKIFWDFISVTWTTASPIETTKNYIRLVSLQYFNCKVEELNKMKQNLWNETRFLYIFFSSSNLLVARKFVIWLLSIVSGTDEKFA